MRGGPRLLCSPYLTGALGFLLVLVGFNYWSISSLNQDLLIKITELQQQLRVGSDAVEETDRKFSIVQKEISQCDYQKKDLLKRYKEKESTFQQTQLKQESEISRLEEETESLQAQLDKALEQQKDSCLQAKQQLEQRISDLQGRLKMEAGKAAELQSKLAGVLVEDARHVKVLPGPVGGGGPVGEGQLPDVDPAAVSVVKKDSLGPPGLKILPLDSIAGKSAVPPPLDSPPDKYDLPRGISSSSPVPESNSSSTTSHSEANQPRQVLPLPDNADQLLQDSNNNQMQTEGENLESIKQKLVLEETGPSPAVGEEGRQSTDVDQGRGGMKEKEGKKAQKVLKGGGRLGEKYANEGRKKVDKKVKDQKGKEAQHRKAGEAEEDTLDLGEAEESNLDKKKDDKKVKEQKGKESKHRKAGEAEEDTMDIGEVEESNLDKGVGDSFNPQIKNADKGQKEIVDEGQDLGGELDRENEEGEEEEEPGLDEQNNEASDVEVQ